MLHLFNSCLFDCSWEAASLFLPPADEGAGKTVEFSPNIVEPELRPVSDSDRLNAGKMTFSIK